MNSDFKSHKVEEMREKKSFVLSLYYPFFEGGRVSTEYASTNLLFKDSSA